MKPRHRLTKELMLHQPEPQTVRWEYISDRLWIAYDEAGNRTDSIYCPYRVGNQIPDEVIGIEPVSFGGQWFWEIEVNSSSRHTFTYIPSSNRCYSECGIEVYGNSDRALVIVTELPDNPGMSICNAFEDLLEQVCQTYQLDREHLLWIEHWEKWKVSEGAPYDREEEEWLQVQFERSGNRATNPRWLRVTASFVEAAKELSR